VLRSSVDDDHWQRIREMTYTVDEFLDGRVTLFGGDNREVLKDAPDDSIDAILTDGPYALVSIVKRFGGANAAPAKGNAAFTRASKGFMGKTWDTGEVVNDPGFWGECLRVLKPGGHLLSFGGTRTYHRMACAVEDAGFEIRDMIQWIYGSGFPKSHSMSLAIDKAAGVDTDADDYKTESEWEGYGTALKPANEPICLARKPLSEKTVAANVLRWGTGAINIDGCRVEGDLEQRTRYNGARDGATSINMTTGSVSLAAATARFPANVITDGSDEVVAAFPTAPGQQGRAKTDGEPQGNRVYGALRHVTTNPEPRNDSGSAARFFYKAKANKTDRANSKHPTVKPVALMRYLARLITPPGGTILDPFAGSGTTGEAAYLEGFNCYLMEREQEYRDDIAARFNNMTVVEQPAATNDNAQIDLEDAIRNAA
jgi:DNA modification methylase